MSEKLIEYFMYVNCGLTIILACKKSGRGPWDDLSTCDKIFRVMVYIYGLFALIFGIAAIWYLA